jgi:hypothetical protein
VTAKSGFGGQWTIHGTDTLRRTVDLNVVITPVGSAANVAGEIRAPGLPDC